MGIFRLLKEPLEFPRHCRTRAEQILLFPGPPEIGTLHNFLRIVYRRCLRGKLINWGVVRVGTRGELLLVAGNTAAPMDACFTVFLLVQNLEILSIS